MNSLNFYLFRNVLISPSLLKDSFGGYWIPGWSVFVLAYWIYQSPASGLQSFPWEVCWKFYWGSHVCDPLLPSWYFNIFLFVFWKFDYNMPLSSSCCCSVTGLSPTLCNPMDCSMSGLPVPHYLQEFVQVYVCWISDALQPSYPLLPSSPFVFSLSQHQGLFQWVGCSGGQSIGASASFLPVSIQGWFPLGLTGWISLQSKGLSRVFSSTTIWKHQFLNTQVSLWLNSHVHTWLLERL